MNLALVFLFYIDKKLIYLRSRKRSVNHLIIKVPSLVNLLTHFLSIITNREQRNIYKSSFWNY